MHSDKQALRSSAKVRRQEMTLEAARSISSELTDRLLSSLDWNSTSVVHCYVANESAHEPLTMPLLEQLWQMDGMEVYIPRISGQNLESVPVTERTIFNLNHYNIPEPEGEAHEPSQFDVVIVPTLAFDTNCNRLGYGQGYYDRFLERYPNSLKIGLAYEADRVAAIPIESHDIPLDMVITESATYTRATE